jgi:hypothetical protein
MAPPFALRTGWHTASASRRLMGSSIRFAEQYCQQHNLAPERFVERMLAQALYPHAHILYVILVWVHADFGAADLNFINGVGRLSRLQDFWVEAEEFGHHPRNFGFLRQRLLIRVSARRLRRLMKKTMRLTTAEATWSSAAPWPARDPAPVEKTDAGVP